MPGSLISTGDLRKSFGDIAALDGLDLEIPPGVTGLVGANGAGKTTLIRLLLGLIAPTSGHVSVFGVPVDSDPSGLRERIGYMPEGRCLPADQTAADFVAYAAELAGIPASEARRRSSETLFLVGMHEERFRYIGDFSTGMRQRVKLAQSIVHDPALVLLDEPASGLDPQGRDQMLELITRLDDFEINVLFSSHILDDIEQTCEWVVMLDRGRVIRSSPLDPPIAGDEVSVEVFGDPQPLIAALESAGATASRQDSIISVRSSDLDVFDLVRDALATTGTAVRRMGTSLSSLEDQFVAATEDQDG